MAQDIINPSARTIERYLLHNKEVGQFTPIFNVCDRMSAPGELLEELGAHGARIRMSIVEGIGDGLWPYDKEVSAR